MEINSWLVFASLIAAASISPGPNVIAVVVHTVEAGTRGSIATIAGNLIALFTIAAAAAIGVGGLLQAAPELFISMKIAGGIYLLWMGIKLIKSSFGLLSPLDVSTNSNRGTTNIDYAIKALFISYSNPKSILFLSSVFPAFIDNTSAVTPQFMTMFLTIIAIVAIIHGSYAIIAMRMRDGLVGEGTRKLMARFSGLSFLGFGLGLIHAALP